MSGPLAGIKVLEVAQWWFVPAAGAVLADWGAEVVKIEHPVRGDAQRGLAAAGFSLSIGGVDFMMQQSNRGKRSVGLDIAVPAGRELLLRMARDADVFLTNFLPSARAKLAHRRRRHPRGESARRLRARFRAGAAGSRSRQGRLRRDRLLVARRRRQRADAAGRRKSRRCSAPPSATRSAR